MHGAGNDYVYIDARDRDADWPSLSIAMSDRHTGVGADGIILLRRSDTAHIGMTMFNADGSEGEMCGNGIRCLVGYAQEQGVVPSDAATVTVETASGVLDVVPVMDRGRLVRASVRMGAPRFRPEDIPVDVRGGSAVLGYPITVDGRTFKISCVSMGNPHAVAFLDEEVDDVPLHEIGPLVEHHPLFPQRVNFEIANVVDSHRIKARVWERGSGLTMACGTGACAVVAAAHRHEYVNGDVTVALPGGELQVRWPGHGDAVLEGPVEEVFEGEWPDRTA